MFIFAGLFFYYFCLNRKVGTVIQLQVRSDRRLQRYLSNFQSIVIPRWLQVLYSDVTNKAFPDHWELYPLQHW